MRRFWLVIGMVALLGSLAACSFSDMMATAATLPRVERDVEYGKADGQSLKLNAFVPARPDNKPVGAVILIHGGGWAAGNKEEFDELAQGLADMGYVSFSIDYRLAPAAIYPAQVDDVQRAVRWVRANAVDYGVDPGRICALGGSAGGHLAAVLGTTDTRDNSDPDLAAYSSRVNCVVDLYGPADLTLPISTQAEGILLTFMGQTREQAPDLHREASPLWHIDEKTVPFLIFHGAKDDLVYVEQSRKLADALKAADIESTYIEFPDEGHGFTQDANVKVLINSLGEFLKKHIGG